MSPAEARLKEAPSEMAEAEWTQRVNLAACYRLVAHYGWDDLVDTHISARVPGPDHHFLINPYGLMFDEITASSLVKVDLDGRRHQNFLGHFFRPGDRLDDLVSVAAGTSANGPRRCWLRRMILLASRCRES